MAEIDVFKAQLVRPGPDTPWGFRLHKGGHDNQLLITRLIQGSPATNIGLKGGDAVTEIMNRSTRHMGEREAMECLNSNQTSIILTVERRAGGGNSVPIIQSVQAPYPVQPPPNFHVANNVNNVSNNVGASHSPAYQPYDMTGRGANRGGDGWGVAAPKQYVPPNFEEAQSRPFDKPKNPYASPPPAYQPPPVQPPQPQPQPAQEAVSPQGGYNDHAPGPVHYIPEEDKFQLGLPQSRTFKILTSLMQNPMASTDNLPAQRSATLERVMAEDRARRRPQQKPRMKVFMSQQYNNPMGLYSDFTAVESFATQASGVMDNAERNANQSEDIEPSSVQKAVEDEQ